MRESIGGSFHFYLVIIFSALIMLFFVGIIAYSKAYRVKNRIVEIIEKYEKYDDNAIAAINADLTNMGYRVTNRKTCSPGNSNDTNFDYCIYEVTDRSERKDQDVYSDFHSTKPYYYQVVTYIQFEIPLIGDFLRFKVKGETKMLGYKYGY